MKLIQPNCRIQFASQDIDFILSVLGQRIGTSECLIQLLADPETRDVILDDEALQKALLERDGCLRVSTRFYFYILVRHALGRGGIRSREVADYVAELLSEFARTEQSRCIIPGQKNPVEYLFELLNALREADDRTGFCLRAHIGNYSLFLAGVFPERIKFRAEARGFPDLRYYESLGRAQFRAASDHRLAQRYELADVFATLADQFQSTRLALNDIADRLFSIHEPSPAVDALLEKLRN